MIKVANARRKIASLFTAAALAVGSSITLSTPAHAGTTVEDYLTADYVFGVPEYWAGCINPTANDTNAGVVAGVQPSEGGYAYISGNEVCVATVSDQPFIVWYQTTTDDIGIIFVTPEGP